MRRAEQRGRLAPPRAFVKQGREEGFRLHLASMDTAHRVKKPVGFPATGPVVVVLIS